MFLVRGENLTGPLVWLLLLLGLYSLRASRQLVVQRMEHFCIILASPTLVLPNYRVTTRPKDVKHITAGLSVCVHSYDYDRKIFLPSVLGSSALHKILVSILADFTIIPFKR